jgi:DNA-binding transcriptional regulator YiaG
MVSIHSSFASGDDDAVSEATAEIPGLITADAATELGRRLQASLSSRLEPSVLRSIRKQLGMSLARWADSLGVPRSTAASWESGNSICQGLAARVVQLQTGYQRAHLGLVDARLEADELWARNQAPFPTYRQMAFSFDPLQDVETEAFVRLMPTFAIPDFDHSFPLMEGLPAQAVARSRKGWRFTLPYETSQAPLYLWLLKQDLRFIGREWAWEHDPCAITRGHIDASYTVFGAAQACLFARALAQGQPDMADDTRVLLRLELGGVAGRHFVDGGNLESMGLPWAEDQPFAEASVPVRDILTKPLEVAIRLVVELAAHTNPELARRRALAHIVWRDWRIGRRSKHWSALAGSQGFRPEDVGNLTRCV